MQPGAAGCLEDSVLNPGELRKKKFRFLVACKMSATASGLRDLDARTLYFPDVAHSSVYPSAIAAP